MTITNVLEHNLTDRGVLLEYVWMSNYSVPKHITSLAGKVLSGHGWAAKPNEKWQHRSHGSSMTMIEAVCDLLNWMGRQ